MASQGWLKNPKGWKDVSPQNVTLKQQAQLTVPTQNNVAEPPVQDDDVWVPEGVDFNPGFDEEILPAIPPTVTEPPPPRRSTQAFVPTKEYLQSLEQADLAFPIAFEALAQDEEWEIEQNLSLHPFCLVSKSGDPDTMYVDQALQAPDRTEFLKAMQEEVKFLKAMQEEVKSHESRGHWEIRERSEVPRGTKVLPSVWSMKRKRCVATGEVYKHKARRNVHGGKQEHGINFWDTYSPVMNWFTILLFLILAIINKWHTRQVDFVLAFPQAYIECDMYMEIPRGFAMPNNLKKKDYCLQLKKNLYGQKQAGRVWNKHLHKGLITIRFIQSKVDKCLYYRGSTLLLVYVDDGILIGPDSSDIDSVFKELKKLNYDITDEGDLKDYLGVDIDRKDGKVHLTQPKLINQILKDLNFNEKTKSVPSPALVSQTLSAGTTDEPEHNAHWSYRLVIGKQNYLEKSTRPEIAFATHQAARFSSNPRESHTKAVHRIGRYLLGTADKGIILSPTDMDFKVYVDADYSGLWNRQTAQDDPSTAKSRTGFVIMFAGCPIIWVSRLQTEIALSTTKAEYIAALSESLRHAIPIMNLLEESNKRGIFSQPNKAQCTLHSV